MYAPELTLLMLCAGLPANSLEAEPQSSVPKKAQSRWIVIGEVQSIYQIEDVLGTTSVELAPRRLPGLPVGVTRTLRSHGLHWVCGGTQVAAMSYMPGTPNPDVEMSLWDAATGELLQALPFKDGWGIEWSSLAVFKAGRCCSMGSMWLRPVPL